jgi:NADPH-dependent ferric siderophore reductase
MTSKRGTLWFLDRWVQHAVVERVEDVTRRMRRVTLVGEDLTGHDWKPGQQVRVMFKDPTHLRFWLSPREFGDASRTYSLWDYDADAGRYELVVLDHHGDGPGARWIRDVRSGDLIAVGPPEGKFLPRIPSPYHLFVGEETAAVCFGAMLGALGARERVVGAVQADAPEDHLELPRGGDLVRVERGAASASPSAVLVEAVRSLTLPDGAGTAYLAGEAKTIQAVRRHLLDERGWTRTSILTKPFWTPGKRGLE